MKKKETQNKNKEILMLNSYAATIPVWIDSEQKRSQKDWIRIILAQKRIIKNYLNYLTQTS